MPLQIVRDDIVNLSVDAIVNSTNPLLQCAGKGVDARIHYMAGPELQAALNKIKYCPFGQTVVTNSYNLSNCKKIIHAVAPVFECGDTSERELLFKTYESIFSRLKEYDLSSVAVPILSSGANAWPRDEAYAICTSAARSFLEKQKKDYEIIIVIHSRPKPVIEPHVAYSEIRHEHPAADYDFADVCMLAYAKQEMVQEESEDYTAEDRGFCDMCAYWIERKQLSKGEFYSRANITKSLFSSLKHNPSSQPKKTTVYACIIGLRLNKEEAEDLAARAGYVISPLFPLDRMVLSFLNDGIYDIDEINLRLFDKDLPLLGSSM